MYKFFLIGSFKVPAYGMTVFLGIVVANIVAGYVIKKDRLELHQFALIELSGGIGAIVGAKLLAIVETVLTCSSDVRFFAMLQKAGYSYYGGLLLFLISVYMYGVLFRIDIKVYAERLTFLFPFLHAIWKIGCYFGGCCIGVRYEGLCSITYPADINTLSGAKCFPIQLVESVVSVMICLILLALRGKKEGRNQVALYLQLYGMTRFVLEFFRFHQGDKIWSLSHLMSCICFVIGVYMRKKTK